INESIDLLQLLPKQRSYWTYNGSLTTPPLWETVNWIIFKQPILCTEQQLDSFRQLSYFAQTNGQTNGQVSHCNECDITVEENYRSQQPLNERTKSSSRVVHRVVHRVVPLEVKVESNEPMEGLYGLVSVFVRVDPNLWLRLEDEREDKVLNHKTLNTSRHGIRWSRWKGVEESTDVLRRLSNRWQPMSPIR
ncbi:unnamed protein product, partial [Oppiella nova]